MRPSGHFKRSQRTATLALMVLMVVQMVTFTYPTATGATYASCLQSDNLHIQLILSRLAHVGLPNSGAIVSYLNVNVAFYGAEPPRTILMTPDAQQDYSGGSLNATAIMDNSFNLTSVLGPWVEQSTSYRTYTHNNVSSLRALGPFTFNGQMDAWPNEVLNSTVFFAYTNRTISGQVNSLRACVYSVDYLGDSKSFYYYYLQSFEAPGPDYTLTPTGSPATPDSPRGHLYSLTLSHQQTDIASLGWVQFFVGYYWILIVVFAILTALVYVRFIPEKPRPRPKKWSSRWILLRLRSYGPSPVVLAAAATPVFLAFPALSFYFIGYVPPWITVVSSAVDNSIIAFFAFFSLSLVALGLTRKKNRPTT